MVAVTLIDPLTLPVIDPVTVTECEAVVEVLGVKLVVNEGEGDTDKVDV